MKNAKLLFSVLLFAALIPAARAQTNLVPLIITNLVSVQRPGTMFVDTTYDLIDPDSPAVRIIAEGSTNGGASWDLPVTDLSGDVGLVVPGVGKKIVWNAWSDWAGNYTTNAKIRLIADDTASASGPVPTNAPAPNLVWIAPGTFNMSGTMVYISHSFWMGKYEVTQGEFQDVMGTNRSQFQGSPRLPVEQVTWFEAVAYCQQLTAREQAAGRLATNWTYRLPTEAEWEYACRAGTTNQFYYGDDPSRMWIYAWYASNCGDSTHGVGTRAGNRWGLYDMQGNVAEWCSDWWGNLPGGNVTDPQGPLTGDHRDVRGGAWLSDAQGCSSAYRNHSNPNGYDHTIGFRVVVAQVQ